MNKQNIWINALKVLAASSRYAVLGDHRRVCHMENTCLGVSMTDL